MSNRHTVTFDLASGAQALVEIWGEGDPPTIAFRAHPGQTWGPPQNGHEDKLLELAASIEDHPSDFDAAKKRLLTMIEGGHS